MLPVPLQGVVDFVGLRWRFAHLAGERLRKYQQISLQRLLRLVVDRSPFYRDLYANHDLNDFHSLPRIDKSVMMREFDRLNTEGLRLDR